MQRLFLILGFLWMGSAFAEEDKATEAEGPGRCAYCDEHTARIDERDMETNPSALTLLHVAQSAPSEKAQPKKTESSQGVQ